jgi:hypothetical protein
MCFVLVILVLPRGNHHKTHFTTNFKGTKRVAVNGRPCRLCLSLTTLSVGKVRDEQ